MFVPLTTVIAGGNSALLNKNMIFCKVAPWAKPDMRCRDKGPKVGIGRYFERLASASRNRVSNDPASVLPAPFLTTLASAFSAVARW
jgi:hypothetical protein